MSAKVQEIVIPVGNLSDGEGFSGIAADRGDRFEPRHALAVAASLDGLWQWRIESGDLQYSDRCAELLGYEKDEIPHNIEFFWNSIHPKDVATAQAAISSCLEGGSLTDVEFRLRSKAGAYRWFRARGLAQRDPSGGPAAVAGVLQDITDRKQTEEKLRQSLKDWNVTFNSINDLICLLDRDGTIVQCNEGMRQAFGDPNSQLVGRRCYELMHGERSFIENCPYGRMLASGQRETTELCRNDKVYRIVADPVFDENGQIAGAVHVIRDITEHRRADIVLKEQLKFDKLLADLSAAFVNVDSDRLDETINASLRLLVELMGNDRSTLVTVIEDKSQVLVTHSYSVPGCEPFPPGPFPDNRLPWYIKQIRCGNLVFARCLPEDLPAEAEIERRYCVAQNIQSNIVIPLKAGGKALGALTFAFLRRRCEWPEENIARLQMIGEVLANALLRRQSEDSLRAALAENEALRACLEHENVYLREQVVLRHHHGRIIGQSDALTRALSQAERVAVTDTPVLLLGETGTGKELLAQTIHEVSARRNRPMVIVNCASLPATLIESELFGREAGAYTGAASAQVGRFVLADGSTLFLDEIGEFPIELQAKLLRVLQDGRFERLGSPETVSVNVRIVAATNRDLEQAVRDGTFRADLYHRLNVFPIQVPPLRERREDIPLLIWTFVEAFGRRMGKTIKSIPRKTIEQLQRYSWPGNVRELSNIIERAMILTTDDTLHVELPSAAQNSIASRMTLHDSEREHIHRVLRETGWRIRGARGAAEILGIKATTLEARMKKLGIKRDKPGSNIS